MIFSEKLTLASSEVWWGEGRQDTWKPSAATYHTQKWPTFYCQTNQSPKDLYLHQQLPPTTLRSGHSQTAKLINRIVITKSVLTPTNTTQKLLSSIAKLYKTSKYQLISKLTHSSTQIRQTIIMTTYGSVFAGREK